MASERQMHYMEFRNFKDINETLSRLNEYLYDVQYVIMEKCACCGRYLVLFHYIV